METKFIEVDISNSTDEQQTIDIINNSINSNGINQRDIMSVTPVKNSTFAWIYYKEIK